MGHENSITYNINSEEQRAFDPSEGQGVNLLRIEGDEYIISPDPPLRPRPPPKSQTMGPEPVGP